jgi:hypothetical protein
MVFHYELRLSRISSTISNAIDLYRVIIHFSIFKMAMDNDANMILTPLAESIQWAVPGIVTPWYTNNGAMAGQLPKVWEAFALLCKLDPPRGYFPEQHKSICISKTMDESDNLALLAEFNFQQH